MGPGDDKQGRKIIVTYRGERRLLADLAKEHGIDPTQASSRYRHGWTVERILKTPVVTRGGYRKRDAGDVVVSKCETYPDCFHCPYPDCWVQGAHKGELQDTNQRSGPSEGYFEHQFKVFDSSFSRRKVWT